ncbi:MAG: hypothetical protein QXO27_04115 [Candidatus Aenigmatarchaeota archaeon]
MRFERKVALILSIFSCYLILSLNFISAYGIGKVLQKERTTQFIIEPELKIVDAIEPITCDSSGYLTFHAIVENIPYELNIKGIEAYFYDIANDIYYNVSSALSCFPKSDIISNQEITCKIHSKEFLSKLPKCPFLFTSNKLYLTFEISYGEKTFKLTDEVEITIARSDAEPTLEINFNIASPPYPVPEINCKTGSEIDVPVVVHHSELLFGSLDWSFLVNATKGNLIECDELLTNDLGEDGKDKIFLCSLSISHTMFRECNEGEQVPVEIKLKNRNREIKSNFTTTLISRDLDLKLIVSTIEKIQCQIVDEKGLCYPKDPQKNVTVTITGNVPEKLKVFEARYKIDEGNITTTYCKKKTTNTYQCMVFITFDYLPLPQNKNQLTTKTRQLTIFFDVKYMNYYKNISDSTEFVMEGKAIDGLIDTLKVLEEDKIFFQKLKKFFDRWIVPAYNIVNFISTCCALLDMLSQLKDEGSKGLGKWIKDYLWKKLVGPTTGKDFSATLQKILDVLIGNGPGLVSCIAEKAMKLIDEEINSLKDFEKGKMTTELDIPDINKLVLHYYPECRAKNYWESIKSDFSSFFKTITKCIIFFLTFATLGVIPNELCNFMENPIVSNILAALNKILAAVSYLSLLNVYNNNLKSIVLARERINLQLKAKNIIIEYTEAFRKTMETLSINIASNLLLNNLTSPSYDMVKLVFISDREGVLNNNDEVCSGDKITIDYDFEKLTQFRDFLSQLSISNSYSRTLRLDKIKGTYGPIDIDLLLGIDPRNPPPSETYTFTLRYENTKLEYKLKYINHTCD